MFNNIAEILGQYTPVQNIVSGSAINGDVIYSYSPNWAYIFGGIVFCISIYSLFRCIGVLLGGDK